MDFSQTAPWPSSPATVLLGSGPPVQGIATLSPLYGPSGLVVDTHGDLFIDDVEIEEPVKSWSVLRTAPSPPLLPSEARSISTLPGPTRSGSSDFDDHQTRASGPGPDAQGNLRLRAVPGGRVRRLPEPDSSSRPAANTFVTTAAVTAFSATSVVGQAVTFTATVARQAPGEGTPTGIATFRDGNVVRDTESLSGGAASFTTSALASF